MVCSNILSDKKKYRKNKSGLQLLEIEVTNLCNLRCKHCYVNRERVTSLDPSIVKKIIQEANELGVNRLVFTGGEPLLYKEIFKMAKYARNLSIPEVVLFSNGTLLNDEICIKMKDCFTFVQLSIDVPPGYKPHMRPPYMKYLEKYILLLKKHEIEVRLMATLYRSLGAIIDKIIDFAT